MKFLIFKASDHNFHEEREINTIEELKALEEIHPGWKNNGGYKDFIISFIPASMQCEVEKCFLYLRN